MPEQKQVRKSEAVKNLEKRVEKLEGVISKLCHYTGQANILTEFGVEKWEPGKKDMSRWAKE